MASATKTFEETYPDSNNILKDEMVVCVQGLVPGADKFDWGCRRIVSVKGAIQVLAKQGYIRLYSDHVPSTMQPGVFIPHNTKYRRFDSAEDQERKLREVAIPLDQACKFYGYVAAMVRTQPNSDYINGDDVLVPKWFICLNNKVDISNIDF